MNILVACEESQAVCLAFRQKGHRAFSCDIVECSGGHPEWHILGNVLTLLDGRCKFQTMDLTLHEVEGPWDMIIAFPPCTYLSNAGAVWLRVNGEINAERMEKAKEAKIFFLRFYNVDCPMVAIENPTPGRIHQLPEYTQAIQPWMFGDPYTKRTCLWLRGLSPLVAEITEKPANVIPWVSAGCRKGTKKVGLHHSPKMRSKTFPGIARAMAETWG